MPAAKVFTTINYNDLLVDMDMIVTSTSGAARENSTSAKAEARVASLLTWRASLTADGGSRQAARVLRSNQAKSSCLTGQHEEHRPA
ncbi:MAG: hypothetical protein IPF55_09595 [Rhodoferax sp.]|nr:hypothetical protein [Rhodoferax sp.]